MQTYPEYPMNEQQHLERIIKELNEILTRESKRYEMDEHLTPSMRSLLEEEVIPALENELNWEPSDEELGYGSEPPLTMQTRCTLLLGKNTKKHTGELLVILITTIYS
jgi:hypothetical protein